MNYRSEQVLNSYAEGGGGSQLNIAAQTGEEFAELVKLVISYKCAIEDTYPEYILTGKKIQLNKGQNELFFRYFRPKFRLIVDLVYPHLKYSAGKTSKEELDILDKARKLIYKPYGTYPLKDITDSAQEVYDLICRKGFFEITPRIVGEDPVSKILKG